MVCLNRTAVLVIVASVLIGASPLLIDEFDSRVVETDTISFQANATVTDQSNNSEANLGIVTEANLRFGRMPNGSAAVKFVRLNSTKKALVTVDSRGNISENLQYSRSAYVNGEKELSIRFEANRPGFYTGHVDIKTHVPRNRIGERWIIIKKQLFY